MSMFPNGDDDAMTKVEDRVRGTAAAAAMVFPVLLLILIALWVAVDVMTS